LEDDMIRSKPAALRLLAAVAVIAAFAAVPALAQQPQTMRLRGTIEKVDGNTITAKAASGDEIKLNLADKMLVVEAVKASLADIKDGDFIGSGAMPQPDGTQKAIEVHIFAESMRGTGEGFRPWDGAPNSTMTNGTVGTTVTSVDGPVVTVKFKDGEKKIVVTPDVPVVRFEIGTMAAVKPGAASRWWRRSNSRTAASISVASTSHAKAPCCDKSSTSFQAAWRVSLEFMAPALGLWIPGSLLRPARVTEPLGTAIAPFVSIAMSHHTPGGCHDTRRTHRETARHQARKKLDLEIHLRRNRRHVAGADYRRHSRPDETD
jgi:hypothetical protein